MSEKCQCQCAEKHEGHMCMLKSKGMTEAIAELSANPTVVCFICGAEANGEEHVCSPMPIE